MNFFIYGGYRFALLYLWWEMKVTTSSFLRNFQIPEKERGRKRDTQRNRIEPSKNFFVYIFEVI